MNQTSFDFGMIGLGVMGRNFLLNVADHGYAALGLDTDEEKAHSLNQEGKGKRVKGTTEMRIFVQELRKPRKIMLLVPAGQVVDLVIDQLLEQLEAGDLIIDGGNSFYADTDRRYERLSDKGIHYLGVGVSGGAEGARRGPSIMPGGDRAAYELVAPILEAVSAKVQGTPCVAYMGSGAAGHYVKMVHNGIEYALMQLLAEAYDLLKRLGGFDNARLHELFAQWNQGPLQSFLVEITAKIFTQADEHTDGQLIDQILDKAKQKGTGKWTSQNAMDLGVPVPTIDAAVTMRGLSSLKPARMAASVPLAIGRPQLVEAPEALAAQVRNALEFAFIMSYAQGLSLLTEASQAYQYGLDLEAIARIWRGGCIIRAALLEDIRTAYDQDTHLSNLLQAPLFQERLMGLQADTRQLISQATAAGVPCMAFASALTYFDAYRSHRLPLNLVQAQRDFFGSHTYERIDREGTFHTKWEG